MSELQNRRTGELSKYDAMTTKELEEILRLDAQAPEEQESDVEIILYIMEVLTKRKRNNGLTGKTALEAYESFKQNYMTETEDVEITYEVATKAQRVLPRWLRRISAAVVVLAILVLSSVTAQAFGFNIWEAMVKWTQETFHFGEWGNSDTNNNLPYASLEEALEEGNVPTSIVPKQIPPGYKLTEIKLERSPLQKKYRATYMNGEQVLTITVQDHINEDPFFVEQSNGLVEKIEIFGVTYYLINNNKRTQAVWMVDSFECRITGDLTIEELKMIINSIEKG